MTMLLSNCLREDLIVTRITDRQTSAKRYLIKDPVSQETFEFGEEEYFLCQLMDGVSSVPKILAAFQERFQIPLSEADYQEFARQIASFGLLEPTESQVLPTQSDSRNGNNPDISPSKKRKKSHLIFLWSLSNPDAVFSRLASWVKPFEGFFKLLVWALIPTLPIALFTFINNQQFFWVEVRSLVEGIPFLLIYIIDILLLNLFSRILQGIVFTAYGGRLKQFGLTLALGFKPHFYVNLKEFQSLPRSAQLWTYGTPLLFRLMVFVFGVVVWHSMRGTGTSLGVWMLLLAHASLATFLFMACPLWPLYGYYWMVAAFRLPDNFMGQSFQVWKMILSGRRLPRILSARDRLILSSFGLLSILFCLFMIILLVTQFARGLDESFPEIFGLGTGAIILTLLLFIALRKPVSRWIFDKRTSPVTGKPHLTVTGENITWKQPSSISRQGFPSWLKKGSKFLILAGLVVLLFLPYPTKPGGTMRLLTPEQVQIQSPVDGKITRVMFAGGDEQFIRAGTVIAQMEDIELENEIETLQSQIDKALGNLKSQQSQLAKLLATPRKEDVEVVRNEVDAAREELEAAKKQIAVAQQELEVVRKQIEGARARFEFDLREASRLEELYEEGGVSLQDLEDAQKTAEISRINTEEKRQFLIQKQKDIEQIRSQLAAKQQDWEKSQSQLNLLLSGIHPDEIEANRQEVEAARADLERLQKQRQQEQEKLKLTTLIMPLDGYLVTPYLETKVGSYLKQGDAFAVAEDSRSILGEVQVPEYNIGQFSIGKKVEVKLAAYPNETIVGKVVAITPSATDEPEMKTSQHSQGRFVRVLVEIPYSGRILKTGMSGYAKIEGPTKPVIVAFTGPIVRFFQIEIWSWLP